MLLALPGPVWLARYEVPLLARKRRREGNTAAAAGQGQEPAGRRSPRLLAAEDDAQPLLVLTGREHARSVGAARRGGAPDQVVAIEVVDRQRRQAAERLRAVVDAQVHRPRAVRRVQLERALVDVAVAEAHRVPVALD